MSGHGVILPLGSAYSLRGLGRRYWVIWAPGIFHSNTTRGIYCAPVPRPGGGTAETMKTLLAFKELPARGQESALSIATALGCCPRRDFGEREKLRGGINSEKDGHKGY